MVLRFWPRLFSCVFIFAMALSLTYAASASDFVFSKVKIKVADRAITVELANSEKLRTRGLMFRQSMEPNDGMLFIFPIEQRLSFWMKNTFIALSIGYFDAKRTLIEVLDMAPTTPATTSFLNYPSSRPAKYALEMNQGWFTKNQITPGSKLVFLEGEPSLR